MNLISHHAFCLFYFTLFCFNYIYNYCNYNHTPPFSVSYIGATKNFATTNEGDLDGGSRGWTIYSESGDVIYDSGNELEWLTVKVGHYPDERSGNKGNEPENVLYAKISFGVDDDEDTEEFQFLFVASERSNVVFVYEVSDPTNPELIQILPVG